MDPSRRGGYHEEIEALRERARRLVDGLDERQAAWRPAPDRWSVVECLDHLARVAEAYLPGVERAVERAVAKGGEPPAGPERLGLVERWFVGAMEPPPKRSFPAPRKARPELGDPPPLAATAEAFDDRHRRLAELAARADRVDPRQARVRSPFFPLLAFSLGGALRGVGAHGRRHLWQAERLLEHPGFPA